MMDHAQYLSALLSDPSDSSRDMRSHRANCADCDAFTIKLQSFESRLARALRVELGAASTSSADVISLASRLGPRGGPRWMALVASVLFAAVLVGVIWVAVPSRSLAADVVAHMAGEPDAWLTQAAVPSAYLNAVLQNSQVKLLPVAGTVSYASSCAFRGYIVPHLVVQSESGPVTVMVLVHETKATAKHFDAQGYRGMIVPMQGHGALAVLMKDPHADAAVVDRIAAQVLESIVWTR